MAAIAGVGLVLAAYADPVVDPVDDPVDDPVVEPAAVSNQYASLATALPEGTEKYFSLEVEVAESVLLTKYLKVLKTDVAYDGGMALSVYEADSLASACASETASTELFGISALVRRPSRSPTPHGR